MSLTAVAGRTFGDLGAFDRYGNVFQLAGVYLNQRIYERKTECCVKRT